MRIFPSTRSAKSVFIPYYVCVSTIYFKHNSFVLDLAEDRDSWRALVNEVMNIRVL